jgi:hypothetical protein
MAGLKSNIAIFVYVAYLIIGQRGRLIGRGGHVRGYRKSIRDEIDWTDWPSQAIDNVIRAFGEV